MQQVRSASVSQRHFVLTLTSLFGGLALVLAGLGVYGVMALIVAERTQEVGVRLTLGARPMQILSLVLRRSIGLTAIGVACGLALAALTVPLLAGQLYGVRPHDAWTFLAVPVVLLLVATIATMAPARGAMRTDPVVALRRD